MILSVSPETSAVSLQAVMIGDDIVSDVGGAQACGIRGLQVRTGKFRYLFNGFIVHG